MLAYLTAKETPLWFVDTHAGAGAYSLESKFAAKNWRIQGRHRPAVGAQATCRPAAGRLPAPGAAQLNPDGELRYLSRFAADRPADAAARRTGCSCSSCTRPRARSCRAIFASVERRVSVQPARRLRRPEGRAAAAVAPRPGADRPVLRRQGRLPQGRRRRCATRCSASPPASMRSGTRRCSARSRRICPASCKQLAARRLAARLAHGQGAGGGRPRPARQRHVRVQSALETGGRRCARRCRRSSSCSARTRAHSAAVPAV